jgi:hypothetical protein
MLTWSAPMFGSERRGSASGSAGMADHRSSRRQRSPPCRSPVVQQAGRDPVPAGNYRDPAALPFHFGHQRRLLLRRPLPAALDNDLPIHSKDLPLDCPEGQSFPQRARSDYTRRTVQTGRLLAGRAAGLLGTDHLAACRLQRAALDREALIQGRYPGVAVNRHTGQNVSLATRPCPDTSRRPSFNPNETGLASQQTALLGYTLERPPPESGGKTRTRGDRTPARHWSSEGVLPARQSRLLSRRTGVLINADQP